MIAEFLAEGAENATTGRELASILGCDIRTVTEQIEKERREGRPICASAKNEPRGYFLAADREELEQYCDRLEHRAAQLFKTRRALLSILQQLPKRIGGAESEENSGQ